MAAMSQDCTRPAKRSAPLLYASRHAGINESTAGYRYATALGPIKTTWAHSLLHTRSPAQAAMQKSSHAGKAAWASDTETLHATPVGGSTLPIVARVVSHTWLAK